MLLASAVAGCGGGGKAGSRDSGADGATDGASDLAREAGGDADSGQPEIMPPSELTATVLNRRESSFQLYWTAPANNGGPVAGYQVRYARVPITATNFDDAAITTAVPFTGTPAAPGALEGVVVRSLYIENNYFFAVAATDAGGAQVWMQATTVAVAAHFNRTVFPSTSGTNEELGYSLNAEGDVNGDGLSDILAGTFNGGKAYLFFGNQALATAAPAVTFSGAGMGFGNAVSQIGDIDGDTRPDIAISDPGNTKVYIYKGRTTWPLTLTDVQADYVISGDATYAASALGSAIARLGDFTGDGVDDIAIGARSLNTSVGRIIIVPGRMTGFASLTLPNAGTIVIDGDATMGRMALGLRLLGLGHYYTTTAGTTLVASAPGVTSDPTSSAGHVYAFHGQTGTAGAIALASADQVITGPAAGTRIGVALSNLGHLLGTTNAVGIGSPSDTVDFNGISGAIYVTHGTPPTTGPLANKLVVSLGGGGGVGAVVLGGGLSGRDVSLSLIGDATPDLVVGAETSSLLNIIDGAKLASKTAPIESTIAAEVAIPLPTGWSTGDGAASLIPDINGDGIVDFCIGNAFGAVPGAVAVYW